MYVYVYPSIGSLLFGGCGWLSL